MKGSRDQGIKGSEVQELMVEYEKRRRVIGSRLREFKGRHSQSQEEIFGELCFCLFTPQSKAETCDRAVKVLARSRLLLRGSAKSIASRMRGVRFKNQKARFLIEARRKLLGSGRDFRRILCDSRDNKDLREWLVKNIKGIGYKEASHFLRNVGLGKDLAILDRHILKSLASYGVTKEIPKTLTRKMYLQIEKKMLNFSRRVRIPMEELDLLFWSMQTGKVFK